MKDSSALLRVRNYLLDSLNYYQSFLSTGRSDILSIMNVIHYALVLSNAFVRYDEIKKKWYFV